MAESTVQSIDVRATPEACFDVAADIAVYPDWATGVRSTEILEETEDGRVHRATFVIDGMVKEIEYSLTYRYDYPNEMTWSADPGDDIKELEGSYRFESVDEDHTRVTYALRAEPAFSIPGFLRKQVEKQIVTTALRGLRSRVEAGS